LIVPRGTDNQRPISAPGQKISGGLDATERRGYPSQRRKLRVSHRRFR
jgi:hypothetical protein